MTDMLGYAPIAAAAFAVPQFLPQVRKLQATHDTAGLSLSWATLTTINNAAWAGYFSLSHDWTALLPSSSVTLLAGTLTIMLIRRQQPISRHWTAAITCAPAALATAYAIAGRDGLGTLLTAASAVQVAPSIWTAYRTARPSGLSTGTWALILGELACFLIFGLYKSDPRLIALGIIGVSTSTLMLARIYWAGRP